MSGLSTLRPAKTRHPSDSTHLAEKKCSWLAGPGLTLLCSRRSPGHSRAVQTSQRAQPSLGLATTQGGPSSVMPKLEAEMAQKAGAPAWQGFDL